ncbi:DHH family phosphoesterase [Candidatus Woesearchaeota archaeon]|nr:DHH family phosphoesterase [Candidatus Woesearchaeota archaeon]
MIPKNKIKEIRNYLDKSENPMFFFDDDADGSCSYILFKKYCNRGRGIILKSLPILDLKLFHKVESYSPDVIFVLDIAVLEQEFIDECNVPVIWIDHHPVIKRKGVHYYNPLIWSDKEQTSTTACCYSVTKQDLWMATLGAIADWTLPEYAREFSKKYPELLPKNIRTPPEAIFETKLGFLIKILLFNLKGKTTNAMKSLELFTKINDPYEILNKTTKEGNEVYKNAEKYLNRYNKILESAESHYNPKDRLLLFVYPDRKISFTSELSNELLYKYPNNAIVVGREKGDEIKLSFRSSKFSILDKVKNASKNLHCHFGGHEHACGGAIKSYDFDIFLKNLRSELK